MSFANESINTDVARRMFACQRLHERAHTPHNAPVMSMISDGHFHRIGIGVVIAWSIGFLMKKIHV